MRPKSLILLALALGSGLVAALGINQVLANRGKSVVVRGETEPIFVAMTDIEYGEEVNPQNVKLEEWPKDKIPEDAIRKLENVEERKTRTKIYAGEPIVEVKLLSKNASEQGATALIPPGYRVVSVKVNAVSGGSALIMPNDRVDVLVHLLANPGRGLKQTATKTILQDVRVFAVDANYRHDPEEGETAGPAKTISLLVTPSQAELVTLASELGNIRLTMRSPEDEEMASTDGAKVSDLLGLTDHGNRDEESLFPAENKPSADNSLLGLLNRGQAEPQPEAVAASGSTWTMLVLSGQESERVEFTEDGQVSGATPLGSSRAQGSGITSDGQDADSMDDSDDADDSGDDVDSDFDLGSDD